MSEYSMEYSNTTNDDVILDIIVQVSFQKIKKSHYTLVCYLGAILEAFETEGIFWRFLQEKGGRARFVRSLFIFVL